MYTIPKTPLKKAEKISEILDAFQPEPLQLEDKIFFVENTMEARIGEVGRSPLNDLFNACNKPSTQNAHLLLGHRGCGKSTELIRLHDSFIKAGFPAKIINCNLETDIMSMVYDDLILITTNALLEIAQDKNITIPEEILTSISQYFQDTEMIDEQELREINSLEAGIGLKMPIVLKLFASVKGSIRAGSSRRIVIRKRVEQSAKQWIEYLTLISNEITQKSNYKQPVLILEELDKIEPERAWIIFGDNIPTLAALPFPCIYTMPIALSYHERIAAFNGYFEQHSFPMIEVNNPDRTPNEKGRETLRKIAGKRADFNLFDEDVLDYLIEKSGGSLRELFQLVRRSAVRAVENHLETVGMKQAKAAATERTSDLSRLIERRDLSALEEIRHSPLFIQDKKSLLRFLRSAVAFEYNSIRWHDLHPLIADFLIEQKLIKE